MKNNNLFTGFGLVLIVIAIAIYYLMEDTGRNSLIAGALAGLGFIAAFIGLLTKRNDKSK